MRSAATATGSDAHRELVAEHRVAELLAPAWVRARRACACARMCKGCVRARARVSARCARVVGCERVRALCVCEHMHVGACVCMSARAHRTMSELHRTHTRTCRRRRSPTHTHAYAHTHNRSQTRAHAPAPAHTPVASWLARAKIIIGGATTDRPVAGRAHRVDVAVADEDLRRRAARRRNGLCVCVFERILERDFKTEPFTAARRDRTSAQTRIRPAEQTHTGSAPPAANKQTNKNPTNKKTNTHAGRPGKG
jgi:hypothetical protein